MDLWMRERIFSFATVIMRVPPLFVIDELLRIGLGLTQETVVFNGTEHGPMMESQDGGAIESTIDTAGYLVFNTKNWSGIYSHETSYSSYCNHMFLMTVLRFLACCFGCAAATCTFMLWTKQLIILYLYLISVGVVFVSYWSNVSTIDAITTYLSSKEDGGSVLADVLNLQFTQLMSNGPGIMIIQNIILQSVLAHLYCYIHLAPKNPHLQKILIYSFTLSSQVGILPLPASVMTRFPVFAALIPLAVCKYVLWCNAYNIWMTIHRGYQLGRNFITNYGLSALAETQWSRLHVPSVLRTFWILRVAEQVVQILSSDYGDESFNYYTMLKTLMVNGCETVTAVLGMTSIISVICHYIGSFFHWILLTDEDDEKSIGTVSAMLFYILALQTGLTSLDKENRLLRLCRNLCLLFTAVLHFVHSIVNPLLMSLSASHNPALHRHVRALAVCAYLIVFPAWLLSFLWSHYTISTWLLAVTVFSIEVIVKVFVSLAVYSLFLYDAYRKNFWDDLDNWIYIIRSFGNTVEFAFGIILFFNGFWILVFEAGGTIRAIMMCVHAYFNLWSEAKAGWDVFMKRRHAVNKINSLPEASKRQLDEHQDVCAICYQEMESAKITKCNHLFHGVCLRKWLYVQDRCPLCHEIMHRVPNQRDNNEAQPVEEQPRNEERERDNEIGNDREEASGYILSQMNSQNDSDSPRTSPSTTNPRREQAVEER
ncbi:protein TRC8 homolog isoform X2 [Nasonia vitripennis]|uniref:RING-type domain-containing protein n=1 Tax=Nasonia vitripennis TaxID=7425 RepID=A0A7M7H4F4_NASVI|nr:protein TRC8 homolog isoform X2 [Nasonia vitripennis]